MLDKDKVKELYLKGYGACQISNILNCKPETIRKCIERNLKYFKNSHLANKIRDKEIDRITKYESKKYMSDATFVKKNRSIYKTTADGDLVVDRNVAPIITEDTPRRLVNRNSKKEVNRKIIKSGYRKEELLY